MISFDVRPVELDDGWDAVVAAAGGSAFASARYLRLIETQLEGVERGHLGALTRGELVGAMPSFTACRKELGCVSNSSPYYGSHGGAYSTLQGSERAACVEALLRAYYERCAKRCVVSNVVEPLGSTDGPLYETVLRPWRTDERVGQVVEGLEASDDAMLARYHQKTRNMVRKARREGVTADAAADGPALAFLAEVHAENMAAIGGKPKAPAFFAALPEQLEPGRDWMVYEAHVDGERAAALLVLFFGDSAEYFTPVIRREHRSSQPMSLLVHRAILDAAERGLQRFNLGGTWRAQEGVYRFKSRWDATDVPYRYYVSRYARDDHPLFAAPAAELLGAFDGFYVYPLER